MATTKEKPRGNQQCAACILEDNDHRVKQCEFCSFCGKWLCAVCMANPRQRLKKIARLKGMDMDTYLSEMAKWYAEK